MSRNLLSVRHLVVFAATSLMAAPTAWSASWIVVGTHHLFPDQADQSILIFATGDGGVRGFNLRAQLGDGLLGNDEPVFESIDFGGGIWDAFARTVLQTNPLPGAEQFFQPSVVFDNTGDTVPPEGLIATLRISTEGIHSGTFPLALANTDIGEDSDFILVGGASEVPTITNGMIVIIPEPGTAWLLFTGLAAIACLRLRRSGRSVG